MTNLTDRIVALGLSGGPKLTPDGAKPALALVAGGQTYLVDCGFETAKQLVASGLGFADLKTSLSPTIILTTPRAFWAFWFMAGQTSAVNCLSRLIFMGQRQAVD